MEWGASAMYPMALTLPDERMASSKVRHPTLSMLNLVGVVGAMYAMMASASSSMLVLVGGQVERMVLHVHRSQMWDCAWGRLKSPRPSSTRLLWLSKSILLASQSFTKSAKMLRDAARTPEMPATEGGGVSTVSGR